VCYNVRRPGGGGIVIYPRRPRKAACHPPGGIEGRKGRRPRRPGRKEPERRISIGEYGRFEATNRPPSVQHGNPRQPRREEWAATLAGRGSQTQASVRRLRAGGVERPTLGGFHTRSTRAPGCATPPIRSFGSVQLQMAALCSSVGPAERRLAASFRGPYQTHYAEPRPPESVLRVRYPLHRRCDRKARPKKLQCSCSPAFPVGSSPESWRAPAFERKPARGAPAFSHGNSFTGRGRARGLRPVDLPSGDVKECSSCVGAGAQWGRR